MPQICFAFGNYSAAAPQMGRTLYDKVLTVRNAMDRADKIFAPEGYKVTKACFLGTPDEMARPSVAAPALFAIQVGIIDALKSRRIHPQFACASGLSELAMAVSLGGWPFEEAIRALRAMAREIEEGREAALPKLVDPSPGPYALFSLKTGNFTPVWRELLAASAWSGESEAGFPAAVNAMRSRGMDTFVEIGAGESMGARVHAADTGIRILSTFDAKSLSATLKLAV